MKRIVFSVLAAAVSLALTAQVTTPLHTREGQGGGSGYLFAYFEGGGDQNLMEQLRFAVSEDAHNWYALNGNRPIIASDSISEIAGNSNTTHPAIVQFKDRWLFFSHNGALPDGGSYSRSIIAEPLTYDADGRIRFIPATSQGALQ